MTRLSELAGRLRERIAIERRDPARDATGGAAGEWLGVGQAWAAIEPVGRVAAVEADALRARLRWAVTLRSEAEVRIDDRLIWRGNRLRVRRLVPDPRTPDRLVVEAEEEL